MDLPKFSRLNITGDISIEPVIGRIPHDSDPDLYLIIGPTGSGKSSVSQGLGVTWRYNEAEYFDMHLKFIEALADESQQLSISKDQLAGYTQTVKAYQVVNVTCRGHPMYLVDMPGFSDSKISEVEIIDMVRKWMKDNGLQYVQHILYLVPISETRLPGSRRRTMGMLKQLLGPNGDQGSVRFITTMWDMLHNERTRKRAESNFVQLRDEVCKASIEDFFGEHEVLITRFTNTKNSALEVLNGKWYFIGAFLQHATLASLNLYQDLHERIEGALQVKRMINSELAQPQVQTNADLRAILEHNQRENHETLTKFIAQLVNFVPLPPGSRHAAQRLRKSIAANTTPPNYKYKWLHWQWEHEAEIPADHDSDASTGVLVIKGLAQSFFKVGKRHGAEPSDHGE